jgi:heme/copper-type cytochrome/quinol oxidase subunit 2
MSTNFMDRVGNAVNNAGLSNPFSSSNLSSPNLNSYQSLPPTFPRPAVIKTGGSMFIYFLMADIVLLLIGVILIVVSQSKCKDNANGDDCKNYKIAGITMTAIASVLMIVTIAMKLKK